MISGKKHSVIVVGAGASGMAAAVCLAEGGADVALLEANDIPGKKLLATGNGKCNFTNNFQSIECYRGEHPEAAIQLLARFDVPYILQFFEDLGIPAKQRDGYWYPNSEQSASVREAFVIRLQELHVPIYENTYVKAVSREKKGDAPAFFLTALRRDILLPGKPKKDGKKSGKPKLSEPYEIYFEAEFLVLATGGCAGNISGADGSGYALAEYFGHRIIPPVPALVQLHAKNSELSRLFGVRVQAKVTLQIADGEQKRKWSERGEILFTESGLSGIPTMQLSRFASRVLSEKETHKKIEIFLDFFPEISENDLQQIILKYFAAFPQRTPSQALIGMLPAKLLAVLLSAAGFREGFAPASRLAHTMKYFCLEICGTNEFASAQVTAGGVDLEEIKVAEMESKLTENLYIVGELADIDGTCGGYNLQWAWMSGLAAAEGLLAKKKRSRKKGKEETVPGRRDKFD